MGDGDGVGPFLHSTERSRRRLIVVTIQPFRCTQQKRQRESCTLLHSSSSRYFFPPFSLSLSLFCAVSFASCILFLSFFSPSFRLPRRSSLHSGFQSFSLLPCNRQSTRFFRAAGGMFGILDGYEGCQRKREPEKALRYHLYGQNVLSRGPGLFHSLPLSMSFFVQPCYTRAKWRYNLPTDLCKSLLFHDSRYRSVAISFLYLSSGYFASLQSISIVLAPGMSEKLKNSSVSLSAVI